MCLDVIVQGGSAVAQVQQDSSVGGRALLITLPPDHNDIARLHSTMSYWPYMAIVPINLLIRILWNR